MHRRTLRAAAVTATLAGLSASALATWSIILVDTRTGEVAIGCATCLTNRDLQQTTPILISGIGGGAAQSSVDTTGQNRIFLRDGLVLGTVPTSIISGLATFDSGGHQSRQYGIVDTQGRFTTFTGTGDGAWAGGRTGTFTSTYLGTTTTIAYAIQGNVLTGPPVVDSAVAAARDTAGDLPAKLMAAMEAARSFGGDGRCSCVTGDPPACGSPPPSFDKSAHVGYLLSARAGDVDAGHGIYRTDTNNATLVVADTNGDGRPDIVTGSISSNVVNVLKNATPPGLGFAVFNQQVRTATAGLVRGLDVADINRDGRSDVIVAGGTFNKLSVHRGSADGNLTSRSDFTNNGTPGFVVAVDLDGVNGPDLAAANTATNDVTVRFNTGAGGMGAATTFTAGTAPGDFKAMLTADVNQDSKPDLIILCGAAAPGGAKLAVLQNTIGSGTNFTALPDIPLAGTPVALVKGDFNGDGRPDLAVLQQASPATITVLLATGPGTFAASTFTVPDSQPLDIAVGDMDRDGNLDIVAARTDQNLQVWRGDGLGGFTATPPSFVGQRLQKIALADFNGDGVLDCAAAMGSTGGVTVIGGRPDGTFWSGQGAAMGDYFLEINYPNGDEGTPDPVFILRERYDAWRAALIGRADAVQSAVDVPAVFAGAAPTTLTVRLRDWQGNPVTTSPAFTVQRAGGGGGGAGVVTLGAVTPRGGGVYDVQVSGSTEGADSLIITANDGGPRPIQLMPRPVVRVVPCPADFDASGGTPDQADIDAFVQAWLAGAPSADADRSGGTPDLTDLTIFFDAWLAGGC